MAKRLTVRLDQVLYKHLQTEARLRHTTLSALVREALPQVLGQSSFMGAPSAPPPGNAWELLLARCPPEVQTRVRQTVDRTGLSLADVLTSLVIAAVMGAAGAHLRPGASPETPASSLVSNKTRENANGGEHGRWNHGH